VLHNPACSARSAHLQESKRKRIYPLYMYKLRRIARDVYVKDPHNRMLHFRSPIPPRRSTPRVRVAMARISNMSPTKSKKPHRDVGRIQFAHQTLG
jgi:hypothetical protein